MSCGDSTHLAQGESISLILMAAGSSSRFTQTTPKTHAIKKQWLRVGEKPLWLLVADTLSAIYPFAQIYITASEQEAPYMQKFCSYTIVVGGDSRQESLQNAMQCVNSEWVLVSDVARAGVVAVGRNIITALIATGLDSSLESRVDCVAPILEVPDTSIYDGTYVDRSKLSRIQTPQLSRTSTLRSALESKQGTDESSIIKANGGVVRYIQGDRALEKITLASDLLALEQVLMQEVPSWTRATYVGNGLDVHSFEVGKVMKLGGVVIESELGFKAHSDGDVALHSLIDAILGAMGAGDIGEWFPDSSSAWAGADSAKLLEIVWDFAKSVGYELYNIDLTIIAQTPRLSTYKQPMRARIAEILGVPLSAINIKATTTEYLGFIGRAEGVCVMSSVCLRLVSFTEVAQMCR